MVERNQITKPDLETIEGKTKKTSNIYRFYEQILYRIVTSEGLQLIYDKFS